MGGRLIDPEYLVALLHVGRQLPAPICLVLEQRLLLLGTEHFVIGAAPADLIFHVPLSQTLLRHEDPKFHLYPLHSDYGCSMASWWTLLP